MKKNVTYRNSEGLPGGPNRVETLVNAFFQAQMAPFMTPKFPDGGPVNTYKWGEINEEAFTGGVGLNSEKFDLDLYGSYPLNVRERQFQREEGIKLPGSYEANASYRFNPKFNINAGAAYNYGQPSYNINTGYNKGPFNINAGASFNRGQLPSYNLGLGYNNDKVNFNAGIDLQNGNPYYNAGLVYKFQDGGGVEPVYSGELETVTITEKAPDWLKHKREYETANPYDEFFSKKKQEYIKSRPKNLTKLMGIGDDDIPESVINSIYNEYEYNRNNYVTKNLGKTKGFNPRKHDEWVDQLTDTEKKIISNSKYGENIQPSYWARSAAGFQELGNTLLPGKPFNFNIPGLTEKEQQDYRKDKWSALQTLAPLDIPGVVVSNYLKNSNREQPNIFSGKPMANVTDLEAGLLNPMLITGIGGMAKGLVSAPNLIRQGSKTLGKTLGTETGLLSKTNPVSRYAKDVVGASKDAGKLKLPQYQNVYRVEHQGYNFLSADDKLNGKWFLESANPQQSSFYLENLKHPITGEVLPFDPNHPARVMRARLPKHQVEKMFGENMPEAARIISQGPGKETWAEAAKYFEYPGLEKRLLKNNLLASDRATLSTAPWLYNPKEGILPANMVNSLRITKPTGNYGRLKVSEGTALQMHDLLKNQYKIDQARDLNSFAKYLPFSYKQGGTPKTFELELDDDAIEYYKSLGYKVEYSEGGDVISQHGWDYKKEGDQYLTRKTTGTGEWITAKGTALDAIKSKVYNENTQQPLVTPKVTPEDGQYIQNFNPQIKSDKNSTTQLQQKLVDAGYNIGNYGSEKNGVDGRIGPKTLAALNAYKTGVSPSQFGTEQIKIKNTPQGTIKIKDTETLPDGFLPVLNDYNTSEKCIEGKKCSYNTSVKMGNLFSGTGALESASQVWAQDAWFNRDQQIRDGGTLIYSTDERDMSKMPKLPKELYSKLQIGDYVHLNRAGRPYEGDVKGNLKNEKLEHVGFIIGKDKDGTPLVWHGSEKGTAYIQRIDGLINLPDHANPVTAPDGLVYQVASVVRNPNLKEFNEKTKANIENMEMFKEFNSNIKLKPTENSTSTQKEAFEVINNNMKNFKMNGYDQEDLAKVGQLLTGGIMQMESEGNEGSGYWYRKFVKEPAAAMVKSAGYKKAFERDEASTGVYQMKTDYNFTNKDGSLNPLGIKLQKLGVDVNDLYWNIEDQTIAGSLILLENLKALRQQENYDPKTKTYKGIPESYILAKSWQAGSGWQNREKYQSWLDKIDITYSENALDFAKNTVSVQGAPSLADDYEKIMKMSAEANKINIDPQALENLKKQKEAKQKLYETDPEAYYQNELSGQFGPQVSESTSVNIPKTTYPVIKPVAKPVVKAPVKKAPVKKPELVLQKKPQRDLPKALVSDNTNVNTSNYLPVQKFSFNKGGTVEDLYDYIYNSI